MALTLEQAISSVRYTLNEATAVFWTDAEITLWLQEGVRMTVAKMHGYEGDDDLTLITSQLKYTSTEHAWIADVLVPYAAVYDDGSNNYKGLQFIHPKQLGNLLTFDAGPPRYYSFHKRTYYIWPLPTSTEAGNTVNMLYAGETDDITVINDELQHLPILWAQAKAYEKDRMFAQAQPLKQQFFSDLGFEKEDKITRPGESPRQVKTGAPMRTQRQQGGRNERGR